jgi:hypothetical protein
MNSYLYCLQLQKLCKNEDQEDRNIKKKRQFKTVSLTSVSLTNENNIIKVTCVAVLPKHKAHNFYEKIQIFLVMLRYNSMFNVAKQLQNHVKIQIT